MAQARPMPLLHKHTVEKWFKKNKANNFGVKAEPTKGKVLLFNDEFTNFYDFTQAEKAVLLLTHLGYDVEIPKHTFSGRTYLSKGIVDKAKTLANENVTMLQGKVTKDTPMVGLEPSAI